MILYPALIVAAIVGCVGSQPVDDTSGTTVKPTMNPNIKGQIIEGQLAELGQFPYQALLRLDGSFICGGSLIDPRYVLTAAHCVQERDHDLEYTVILGAVGLDDENEPEAVRLKIAGPADVIPHPYYNDRYVRNDLALIRLPYPVEETDRVRRVRLPASSQRYRNRYSNRVGTISGWGLTSSGKESPDLLWGEVLVMNYWECRRKLAKYYRLDYRQICTTKYPSDTCHGDSGGPLTVDESSGERVQIGLVSFGLGDSCTEGTPTVYTDLAPHLPWIYSILRK